MPNLTVLIKPVSGSCNMNCSYCFYQDVANNRSQANMGILSDQLTELLINRAITFIGSSGIVNFAFQGGEPTLCGVDYFRKFTAYVKKAIAGTNCRVQYALQTNGLLLDDDFCKFFADEKFLIGLSIDGPADIHNASRMDTKSKQTFQRVITAAHRLERYKADYNILCVVTRLSVKHPDKLFNFFVKNKFSYVQLIPCIEDFNAQGAQHSPDPIAYGNFLCRMYELWLQAWEQGAPLSIREFDNLMGMLLFHQEPELCSMSGKCGIHAIIEADGSVYPCDFFVLDEWKLGNICDKEFGELFSGHLEQTFIEQSKDISDVCKQCNLFVWCRGGCRRHRESAGDSIFKWCESQKILLPYILRSRDRLSLAVRKATAKRT